MITPSGIDDAFDFEQSSNRMPIECAFGILIQRWGILYRPLRVRFNRRAPLIAACMRLHNFCIDERIAEETYHENGLSEIQPYRWVVSPKFDRDGAPVEHLDIERGPRAALVPVGQDARVVTRDRLMAAIQDAGLERPHVLPPHMHRRQKRKRGGGVRKRKHR